jgi:hypothetical protein
MTKTGTYILVATAFLAAFVMQGCIIDDDLPEYVPPYPATNEEIPIRIGIAAGEKMNAGKEKTRAATVSLDDIDTLGLYGYYTSDERWEWMADNKPSTLRPNYFNNETLVKTTVSSDPPVYDWNYSGQPRFWPPDTRYKTSFFAYSPYVPTRNANGSSINLRDAALIPFPATASNIGIPTLKYTLPENIREHMDLMRGASIDMTGHGVDGAAGNGDDGKVPITMEHALTQISMSLQYDNPEEVNKYSEVVLNSIEISGIYNKGTLRLDNGEWLLDETAQRVNIPISGTNLAGEKFSDGYKIYKLLSPAAGTLMLIPQPLDNVYITLDIKFVDINPNSTPGGTDIPIRYSLKDTGVEWLPGRAIDYRFKIMGDFIYIHATLGQWGSYSSSVTVGI